MNTTTSIQNQNELQGWVSSPNLRGTIDVVWSCLLVIFTCVWTVLHLNIPSRDERFLDVLKRKARWCLFCVWAPEALLLVAAVQRQSARASVSKMHALGVSHWTAVHGFYADMGGFMLHAPDMPPFPVNSKAIHYLVQYKHIDLPTLTKDDIWDRSKADQFAKLVAVVQGGWLILQVVARPCQSLDVTPLELATVSFALCSALTFFFWKDKPKDVEQSTDVHLKCTVAEVLLKAGDVAKKQWEDTPMDFVEQPGWRVWRRRRFLRFAGGLTQRPIRRIPNDYIEPPTSLRSAVPLWFLTSAFTAVHVAGWNFRFPSEAEVWLWRVQSVLVCAVYFTWGFVEVLTVKPGLNFNFTMLGIWQKKSSKQTVFRRYFLDIPGTISAMSYFAARTILVIQVFATLRLMPSSVFVCVSWTMNLPHV